MRPYPLRDDDLETWLFERRRLDSGTGCWEWTGARHNHGYGEITIRRQKWRLHRLAWTLWRGPIPDGMHVCHRCDNPPCFNPEHLFLATASGNMRDAAAKGRTRGYRFTSTDNPRRKATSTH